MSRYFRERNILALIIITFSPYVKNVKKWYFSPKSNGEFGCIMRLLNLLKTISPRMEECVIEFTRVSRLYTGAICSYCFKIDNLISKISQQWSHVSDFCPHIDLKFNIRVRPRHLYSVKDVNQCIKNFSDYKVKQLPSSIRKRRFIVSKPTVHNEKFSFDAQILINCH